ncbi:hypothetical protein BCR34DRAFT_622341 [Clohesyomyces aquaticus]|uniref:Uncharacterized protein n=1 Tax=Clohesyomyces aquaticus TaxID=1231657 RepID=A0A1Y2A2W4_9PLEO|nr:hypothetical protein BCR34DRAFT_622341 [Clohesyomyces aquaticus]
MATLFRDFSFEAASRHPSTAAHEAERAQMNVSPTSIPFATPPPSAPARLPTPPPCTMGELAQRFHQQSLRVNTNSFYHSSYPSYWTPACFEVPLTPPGDDCSFSAQQSPYPALSSTELRQQRQANTRMQCSSTHIKDISMLVQRMVDDRDQCLIRDSKSPSTSPSSSPSPSMSSNYDEGVDMAYSPTGADELPLFPLKFRRSGERLHGQAMVSRSVRMRKKSKVMKRSSK